MNSMRPNETLARARNAFRIGDLQAAEGLLTRLTERYPSHEVGRLLLGSVHVRSGRLQDAAREFQALLRMRPDHPEAHNNLAVVYRGMGQLDRALEEVDKALAGAPDQAAILYNKGNILKQQGHLPQAATAFRRAVRKDQHMVLAYNNLGTTYEAIGDLDEAIRWYRRGLQLDPNHPSLCYNFAIAQERLGDLETARTHLLRALKARPNWPACMNELGVVESRLGAHRQAEKRFREILTLDPADPGAFTSLAALHDDRGDPQGATDLYRTALEHDPAHLPASLGLVRLLEQDGKPVAALEELRKAGIHHPNNVDVQFRIGRLLLSLERFDEAEIELAAILESAPDYAPAHQALGMLYQHQGNSEQAGYHFRRLQEIEPDSIDHFLDRALWHRDNGRYEEAENELQRVLAREPNDAQARELLAEVVAASGHQRHGLQILTELSREHPDSDRYLVALARAKQNIGDTTGAIQDLDSVISLQGRRGSREDIQRLQESLDLYEQLIRDYEQDIGDSWKQNIGRLERYLHSTPQPAEVDTDSLLFDSLEDDETPVIDVGGPEPAIAVPEEIEIMDVTEVDEEVEPEDEQSEPPPPVAVVNPETATHPFTDLLRGEELYPDSRIVDEPELTTGSPRGYSAPGPPAHSAETGGADAGTGTGRAVPQGGRTQPTAPPAAEPPAHTPPPTAVVHLASPGITGPSAPAPAGPASTDAGTSEDGGAAGADSSHDPGGSGLPGAPGESDERRATPEQEHGSGPPLSQTAGVAPGSPAVVVVSGTHSVLEHFAVDTADTNAEDERSHETQAEAEPVQDDSEPEGTTESAGGEEPANDGADGPPVAETAGPSSPTPQAAELPDGGPRTEGVGARESAALLRYLEGLAEHLPDPSRSAFFSSDQHLRIEALRSRLAGQAGLSRFADARATVADADPLVHVSPSDAYATLTFVRNLTKFHPDRGIGFALTGKLTKILAGLRSHSQHGRSTEPEES